MLLQLGDFGFWEHEWGGRRYLDLVQERCEKRGVHVVWIDRNHENDDRLATYTTGRRELVAIRPSIFYAPRGARWRWSGRSFAALGGAHSIDFASRVPGLDWWAGEHIGDDNVDAVTAGDWSMSWCATTGPKASRCRSDAASAGQRAAGGDEPRAHPARRRGVPPTPVAARALAPPVPKRARLAQPQPQPRPSTRPCRHRVEALASDLEGDGRGWGVLDVPSLTLHDGFEL